MNERILKAAQILQEQACIIRRPMGECQDNNHLWTKLSTNAPRLYNLQMFFQMTIYIVPFNF